MPVKNYVFDTNVLIHDPRSIFRFQDNNIFIPIYVLEELDGLKNDPGQRGFAAREAIRIIDELRTAGDLSKGVQIHKDSEFLPEGMDADKAGKLYIYAPNERAELVTGLKDLTDNAILQAALDIKKSFKASADPNDFSYITRTILVTMDINLRVRAEGMGLQVAQYEFQSVDITTLGNEVDKAEVSLEDLNEIYKSGIFYIKDAGFEQESFNLNTSVIVEAKNTNRTALCRIKETTGEKSFNLVNIPKHVLGIKPRNAEQQFAFDLLLDESIELVTLMGGAGTGKTILSLCTGLLSVLEGKYDKLLISRPVMPLGKDIGFLPGDLEAKLDPYMRPFYDNLDYIMMSGGISKNYKTSYDELFENGTIQVEPITFIRGRSIPNQFIIIDESQNMSPHELKTVISRCGEGSKIVLTGDPDQIDNPYLNRSSNGLSATVNKLRNEANVGHLLLKKGERSKLANLAANKL